MIVDCHTHVWQNPAQVGDAGLGEPIRFNDPAAPPTADVADHLVAAQPVDKTVVLAFRSRYLNAEIPNDYVAEYVAQHPERLIGFAGIDPTEPGATDELHRAREQLHLRGVTLTPSGQDFHPQDSRAMRIYELCGHYRTPILFHQGTHFTVASKMEYARPFLLDEIARSFPQLKLIIAHMGHPWIEETAAMLGKHPNIFSDLSSLLRRPWQAYNALVLAHQYGVIEKLLFGSDFPFGSAGSCIEQLYSINQLSHGTNLPSVPRTALRDIVERDALALLGIE